MVAASWKPLGSYAVSLGSAARVHLFEAGGLSSGVRERDGGAAADRKLSWWFMDTAIEAAAEGRFLLPVGPLALFLAGRAA
ncbi:NTP pyrophosphohydrolase, partial [Streptomyces sp. NRRL S-337]|uniref:NTP pyrophosphohydrolase n=1 Tax=Streptomyces sp. NRRL S-337 TaxID=1463900 RepID=UPI0004C6B7C4